MDSSPAADFIKDKLGGPQAVAAKLGVKPNAVRMWAHRKSIPRSVWPELIEKYRGVSLADLKRLEQAVRDEAAAKRGRAA